MKLRLFLLVCAIGLLPSCAGSTLQLRVVSCQTSVEARLQCRPRAFLLEDGTEGSKSKALAQSAEAFDECKTRHADLVREIEVCEKKLEALKAKLNK